MCQKSWNSFDPSPGIPVRRKSKNYRGDERYRMRKGDYRILYTIEDAKLVITVVKVGHRREVYR